MLLDQTFLEFLVEFGDKWHAIINDLLAIKSIDQLKNPNAYYTIFLSKDRKMHVGVLLVFLSIVYLFVFMTDS